jgi:DNA-binding PadR family transcriptional regulator
MSRDFSYEPQDTRQTTPARPARHRGTTPSEVRPSRGSEDARQTERQETRNRDSLKPERLDFPRAYYLRDRAYLLRESEVRTLAELGRFRIVAPADMAKHNYDGDSARMERDLRRLEQQGLIAQKTLEISGKKTLRVAALTKSGKKVLRATDHLPEDQTIYDGIAKPREAKHDADLYRMYHKEAERIEREGGRPARVLLDYELKRDLNRDLAKLGAEKDNQDAKERIAERHGLRTVDGKIPVPDMRIEYETADLELRQRDLELATHHYRPQGLAEKAKAGFSFYSQVEDAPRLRRALDNHDITGEILAL